MKKSLLYLSIFIALLISNKITAQNPVVFEDWTTANGTQNMFVKSFTETDANKNVYIGGATVNGSGDYDMLLSKYDPRGVLLWTQQYGGAGNGDDGASAICFGDSGNVYITGTVYTSSTNLNDCVVLKYDKNGNLKWLQTFNGTASNLDAGTDICIDANYNVYVGGTCTQTGTLQDFLVLKYNKYGQLLWNNSYDGIGMMDISNKISLNDGVVIVAGGTQTNPTKWEYAITKFLQTTGAFSSVTTTNSSGNGIDKVTDLVTDQDGNIYVTGGIVNAGTGYDYHTVKLDSNLVVQWAATYNGNDDLDDMANAIEIDDAGHVFVTGYSTTTNQGTDIVTIRYSSTGTQQGIHTYNDPDNGDDSGEDMLIDDSGNVYISGYAFNGSNLDYHTFKLQSNATLIWEINYDGIYSKDDKAMDLCLDDDGDLIVVGQCDNGDNEYSFITIKYIEKDITMPPDTEMVSTSIAYIENRDQLLKTDGTAASTIQYYTTTSSPAFYFANENYHMVLSELDEATDTIQYCRVDVLLHEVNPKTKVYPLNRRDDYNNYYLAHVPKGRPRVGNFEQLIYPDLYTNIDLMHTSNKAGWKFYYIIKPGGLPPDIDFGFAGNDTIYINNNNLIIETDLGDITFPEGEAYQISSTGTKINLSWQPQYSISGSSVNFTYGSYDSSKPLVFEVKQTPSYNGVKSINNLEWSTYYGGIGQEYFYNAETNISNYIWVNGTNVSGGFPVINGQYMVPEGSRDVVLLQFNNLNKIEWATYYGGSKDEGSVEDVVEEKTALTVDSDGFSYIAGSTNSNDIPVKFISPAYIDSSNTLGDAVYIAKFDMKGFIKWSTYFGHGGCPELPGRSHAINIDNSGNLYVTGISAGIDTINQLPYSGSNFTFISKFNPDLELIWSTYWGGSGVDEITSIEFNNNNEMLIAGFSNSQDLPWIPYGNAYNQPNYQGGANDGFMAKFVNDSPVWVTYMGGNGDDRINGMHQADDNFYVVGSTTSSNFYTMFTDSAAFFENNYQGDNTYSDPLYNGDGFFSKFTNSGEKLHISLYGGEGADGFSDVSIDSVGNLIIIGTTTSDTLPFTDPISSQDVYVDSVISGNQGTQEGIIITLNDSLILQWTTYFNCNSLRGLTITNSNKLYMVGKTSPGIDFPLAEFTDTNAYYQDTIYSAAFEGFISCFNLEIFFGVYNPYDLIEIETQNTFVYPNPSSDYIYIVSDEDVVSYEIYNINGQHIKSGKYKGQISVKELTNGMYFIRINLKAASTTAKFIKRNYY